MDPSVYSGDASPSAGRPSEEADSGPAAPREETPSAEIGCITLHLKKVPLKVVLKYVLRFRKLRYIVEDYAIVIVPIGIPQPEEMVTEIFRLKSGSFRRANSHLQEGGFSP
jgi:hypothetical protein